MKALYGTLLTNDVRKIEEYFGKSMETLLSGNRQGRVIEKCFETLHAC